MKNHQTLIKNLVGIFRKYIFFTDDSYAYLCAIFAFMTHLYIDAEFDEIPYLKIYGAKGSGKTLLGDILKGVCSGSIFSSDISPALLFRIIHHQRKEGITVIIDEAEDLAQKRGNKLMERVLRSGYRKGGMIGRVIYNLPKWFLTFSPKVIINQSGLYDPALESRTISIPMVKSPDRLERFRSAQARDELGKIKGLIHKFSVEHKKAIRNRYVSFNGIEGLAGRDEEIWAPIIVIGDVLDKALSKPFLKRKMIELAKKITIQKRRLELIGNLDLQILEGTRAYVEQSDPLVVNGLNLYVAEEICKSVASRWSLPTLRTETVSIVLKRHDIILDTKRPRLGIKNKNLEVQRTCYLLDKERLVQLTHEYFDKEEKDDQ
jgi:hypothetical protein